MLIEACSIFTISKMSKAFTYHFVCLLLAIGILSIAAARKPNRIPKEKEDVVIHIHAVTSVSSTRFYVDVYQSKHRIKLVYSLFDNLRITPLRQDTAFLRLNAAFVAKGVDAQQRGKLMNALATVFRKYEVYDKDSITLKAKEDTAYVNLIKRVITDPDSLLQDPKDRVVLDGTEISCDLITAEGKHTVHTHSPTTTVTPLLYQLLTQSLNQYRKRKGEAFLTKRRTSGY